MFNIKDIKILKKIIYSLVAVIVIAISGYSGWFLYNNFYNTINYKDSVNSSTYNNIVIKHVNMEEMNKVIEAIEREQEPPDEDLLDISINFR